MPTYPGCPGKRPLNGCSSSSSSGSGSGSGSGSVSGSGSFKVHPCTVWSHSCHFYPILSETLVFAHLIFYHVTLLCYGHVSICLSQVSVLSKWLNLSSRKQRHMDSSFLMPKMFVKWSPQHRWSTSAIFDQYLTNSATWECSCYKTLMHTIQWCYF